MSSSPAAKFVLNQMKCVAYYPKVAIENHYWSNKWRCLKASFHGLDGLPVEVKECGTTPKESSSTRIS